MRLVTFRHNGVRRIGAEHGNRFVDLQAAYLARRGGTPAVNRLAAALLPADMHDFLAGDGWAQDAAAEAMSYVAGLGSDLDEAATPDGGRLALRPEEVRLEAPVPRPPKVIAIGLNYRDHAEESGMEVPQEPILFSKFSSAVIGPGQPIVHPGVSITDQVDYEAELAVVIGRGGRNLSEQQAWEHVGGYTAANDISARDLQFRDGQWIKGKTLDTFAPLGPCLVSRDEIPDPHDLSICLRLNGQIMQDSNTSNLIFRIPALVAFLSRLFTLEPGDVIMTGTPPGVGFARKPNPVFLQPGDAVEVEVGGIGILHNPVIAEAATS